MYEFLDEHVPSYRQTMDRETIMEIRARSVAERPELAHDVSALREEVLYRGIRLSGFDDGRAREWAHTAFQAFLAARQEVVFLEHAVESLAHLADRYLLAAVTNGNADITRIGLDRYFEFALCSADVGAGKPAPDIFLAALDRAGVDPAESIHVGDHPIDDVHGAGSVGMHTIWVRYGSYAEQEPETEPTEVVRHLGELPDAVGRIHDR